MGSQSSGSTSRPLTAQERQDVYTAGMQNLGADIPTATYQAPTQQRLTNGDYNKLQGDLLAGYTAPIDRAKSVDLKASDQAMADRGIYTSLNAIRANNDVNERYIPQYAAAGANATNKRYDLQTAENAAGNQMAMDNAKQVYESKWRPADYKAGLWNGTGGTISSGTSGGWSI